MSQSIQVIENRVAHTATIDGADYVTFVDTLTRTTD